MDSDTTKEGANMDRTAHYFTKAGRHVVIINPHGCTPNGIELAVSGKAEARRVAAHYNAKPWNF